MQKKLDKISFDRLKCMPALLIIFTALPAALSFWYIFTTSVDVPFLTSFFFMNNLEKFYSGTLTFKDITAPYGEHRVIGCNLIFILNAIIFKLDTRVEHWIFYCVYTVTNILFISVFYISYKSRNIRLDLLFLFFGFLISFVNYTLNQHYDTGMGVQVIVGMMFSALFLAGVSYMIAKPMVTIQMVLLAIFIIPTFLIFGTGYTYDAALAVLLCITLRCVRARRVDFQSIVISLLTIAGCVLYIKMPDAYPISGTGGIFARLDAMIHSPMKLINFFLVSFGASVIGQRPYSDGLLSIQAYKEMGLCIFLFYAIAIYSIQKFRKYVNSYLPELLIYYSIFNIAIVCLGRWDYMDPSGSWGVSAWYIYHTKLGIIGIIWTFCSLALESHEPKPAFVSRFRIYVTYAIPLFAIIFIPQALSDIHIAKVAPSIHEYTARAVRYAYFPEDIPVEANGMTPFLSPLPELLDGLKIMRAHNIGPYKPRARFNEEATAFLQAGDIYQDGWAGKSFSAVFETGAKGEVFITTFVHSGLLPEGNGLHITMNGHELYYGTFPPDKLTVHMVKVPPNSTVGLKFVSDRTLTPSTDGVSGDVRQLAFKIGDLFSR